GRADAAAGGAAPADRGAAGRAGRKGVTRAQMKRIKVDERPGWDEKAEALGFTWRHLDGARYWDERAYYELSLAEVEDGIEEPARELHAMCLDLVEEVVKSEAL